VEESYRFPEGHPPQSPAAWSLEKPIDFRYSLRFPFVSEHQITHLPKFFAAIGDLFRRMMIHFEFFGAVNGIFK
jgi:hypothetical protein